MFRWLKRVFIYLVLLIYGNRGHNQFIAEVKKHCRVRRKWRYVHGIEEELDEVLRIPENCTDDVSFIGFSKDGNIASFRIVRTNTEYAALSMEFPGIGRFTYRQTRKQQSGAGSLKLQVLQPMRRWKISFSGRVQCYSDNNETNFLHASVSLYWQCFADPLDFWSCASNWQLGGNLSSQEFSWNSLKRIVQRERIRYNQWGEMRGRIDIEGHTSKFMRLKGIREHSISRAGHSSDETVISHHIIQDEGLYFITNGGVLRQNTTLKETFGYLTVPIGERWVTDQSNLKLKTEQENLVTMQYPLQIKANSRAFAINRVHMRKALLKVQTDTSYNYICFAKFEINGKAAHGLITMNDPVIPKLEDRRHFEIDTEKTKTSNKLTIGIDSNGCKLTSMVGGKAANLSLLRDLGYIVPNGFSVTTYALKLHLDTQPELNNACKMIEKGYRTKNTAEIPALCTKAVEICTHSDINDVIISAIQNELLRTFGANFNGISIAVRSSAVSEDGTESSFAGQMESFLGVRGLDNILLAVRKCWASSFAYRAVEYRRQNGQPVLEEMAVVIQQMVDSDVSGVLFTRDPVTDNSSTMVINAAPGLGETVVSGRCNPDTIKVMRGNGQGDFSINSTNVGGYTSKLICAPDTGMTQVVIDEEQDRQIPCISEEQIVELCRIGAQLEESIGHPQDIEWSILQGQIYLLQTRPITYRSEESAEELLCEFDTPVATDFECVTTSHFGENFPGCVTPLTRDVVVQSTSRSVDAFCGTNAGVNVSKYAEKCVMTFSNRVLLGTTAGSIFVDGFLQDKSALDINMTGRVLHENTMDMIWSYKGGSISKVKAFTTFIHTNFIKNPRMIKMFRKWESGLETLTIGQDNSTALQFYNAIDEYLPLFYPMMEAYSFVTTQAFIPSAVMFKMLKGKSTAITGEINADMAILLADCPRLLTADVPRSLQKLASVIAASDLKETFLQVPDYDGHNCLMSSDISIRRSYEEFMKMHGHRCIKEFNLFEKSWEADPSMLMRSLKMMINSSVGDTKPDKEAKSNADIIATLKSNLTWIQKFLLRTIILDKAKAGIAERESSKSVLVKTVNVLKKAYWRLADLIVREGRLPEEHLLFFLTHTEIGTLLETRSAALVRKARSRMHVFRQQEAVRYPRISFGRPEPISEYRTDHEETSLLVSGMPVGRGVATGRACVVLTLDNADSIQTGDILICPSTDIGWSPYFPMIAGLVTEMGGLISHGAVIAREIGIPCIVNAIDATSIFRTGDNVKIDGLAGEIKKLTD